MQCPSSPGGTGLHAAAGDRFAPEQGQHARGSAYCRMDLYAKAQRVPRPKSIGALQALTGLFSPALILHAHMHVTSMCHTSHVRLPANLHWQAVGNKLVAKQLTQEEGEEEIYTPLATDAGSCVSRAGDGRANIWA